MIKALVFGATLALSIAGPATAQGAGSPADLPPQDLPSNGGAGVRSGNITSTGATVPNPGASQSGGTTSMDRGIQQEDNKIESGICKGC